MLGVGEDEIIDGPFGPLLACVRTNSLNACSSRFLVSLGRTM